MDQTTQEQKIDYIYERLKKQEKSEKINFWARWLFRIAIIWYSYYFITIALPAIIDKRIPDILDFRNNESSSNINMDQIQDLIGEYFSN